MPVLQRNRALSVSSFLIPFSILAVYWSIYIRPFYFPSGDEFSLIVNSTRFFGPKVSSWFLQGFGHYFVVYPEWTIPYTNFIRPAANASYYLNSVLFGTRWSFYLLLNYAVQAGIVAQSIALARQLKLPVLAVGALCFMSPAFGYEAIYYPSFAFDLLAALFVLMGISRFLKDQYLAAGIFFSAAIFTKESALFAPCVAAVILAIESRRIIKPAAFLLPIVAWAGLRHVAFPHSGVYVFRDAGIRQMVAGVVHGFLSWPLGMRTVYEGPSFRMLFFAANVLFWILAAFIALRYRTKDRNVLYVAIFCAGALAMPLLLSLQQRFGASFYPLFFLTLLCIYHTSNLRAVKSAVLSVLLLSTAVNVFQRAVNPMGLQAQKRIWAESAEYIKAISSSHAARLFVVNDAVGGFSSPESVARFAGYSGQLSVLSNLDNQGCIDKPKVSVKTSHNSFSVVSQASCGSYLFDGSDPAKIVGNDIDRGRIHYHIPSPRNLPPSLEPSLYGEMSVQVSGIPHNSSILIQRPGSLVDLSIN